MSPGGILRITLEKEEGFLRFGVYNEGDCIREEDLPRVWDKFYRVGGRSTEGPDWDLR